MSNTETSYSFSMIWDWTLRNTQKITQWENETAINSRENKPYKEGNTVHYEAHREQPCKTGNNYTNSTKELNHRSYGKNGRMKSEEGKTDGSRNGLES